MYPDLTPFLVGLGGAGLLLTVVLAVGGPLTRRLALRQVSRRRAEAALVVAGSVLGTAIIVGSLVVGDTLDQSFKQSAYRELGVVDEVVSSPDPAKGQEAARRLERLRGDPAVDGLLTVRRHDAAVVKGGKGEPRATVLELDFAAAAGFESEFVGYAKLDVLTQLGALEELDDGRFLAKLRESPFYPAGGGQISDAGVVECEGGDCRARVAEVFRLGDDQAVAVEVERGELRPGERVVARVDRDARHATEANHTATHLLHAALRERLGTHVRQAGSYVGPDKLRFDFTHGQALSDEELAEVEEQVNAWVLENHPV
ncbi:MAG TPA: alanine--tRNA ligase-related protein, partial [Actinomycetes bacterium]|nr:alanine--tRNA ligase-related protein [Actinomycetes bacterium]